MARLYAQFIVVPLLLGLVCSAGACRKTTESTTSDDATTRVAEPSAELAALAAERGGTRYLVPVSGADVSRGPDSALVTIVVFAEDQELEHPMFEALDELLAAHPEELRVIIKHRVDGPDAWGARAVLAAQAQGRGWAMYEQIRERHGQRDVESFLDMAQDAFVPDLDAFERERRVHPNPELARQAELAERLGIRRTPVMFVNGALHGPPNDAAGLAEIVTAELALARMLVDEGARADQVYAAFMVHAAAEREGASFEFMLSPPYDGPALATRTLPSGVVVEDIELGSGEPLAEGQVATFEFAGYSDLTGKQVMGNRNGPAKLIVNAATREDPIANAMCDAMLGQRVGGKRRIRVPATIIDAGAPAERKGTGDLWFALELIDVGPAPSDG